jgi:sensor histidine kinase YesM
MIIHCFYNYWSEGHVIAATTDLVDLKTQKYKNIIETLIKEKEKKAILEQNMDQDMDDELMEYMQSKFADNSAEK